MIGGVLRFGYWAVGIGTFLEGEMVLVAAGAMAHRGILSLPLVIVAAFIGSVAGDQLWFLVGRGLGRPFIARHARLAARAAQVERWLTRSGTLFVLGFRFLYGLRTISPLLLGASAYPLGRFLVLNAIGAALWAACFGALGYGLGAGLSTVLGRATRLEEAALAGVVVAFAVWLNRRRYARRRATAAEHGGR